MYSNTMHPTCIDKFTVKPFPIDAKSTKCGDNEISFLFVSYLQC